MVPSEAKTERAETFGEYIKGLRDASGASLRTVAAQVGMSFPHLGRLERGEVKKPPSIHVLTRMAAVYEQPLDEVLIRAGVQIDLVPPEEFSTGEEQFRRLMLSAEFIPHGMKPDYLAHFPLLHRLLIQQLVSNVERHTERRVRWELRGDDGDDDGDDEAELAEKPASMRTYGEVIGAATIKTRVDDDWKGQE